MMNAMVGRTFGMELEFSDIKTVEAVQLLYGLWERDFTTWRDRYGPYSKPKISYDEWNAMSDGSLINSDGSRCMWSIIDDKGNKQRVSAASNSPARQLWKGVEIVSRATNDLDSLVEEMISSVKLLVDNGATAKMGHFNSMHVHAYIGDLPWQQVAGFVPLIAQMQDELDKLSTKWGKRAFFVPSDVGAMQNWLRNPEMTKEHWFERYRTVVYRGKTKMVHADDDRQRRLIDVSPYFARHKPYDTMEFRCFRSSKNSVFLAEQLYLAYDITEALINGKTLDNLAERVDKVLSYYEE